MFTIGFFGASGAGKSALINHFLGAYAAPSDCSMGMAITKLVTRYDSRDFPNSLFRLPVILVDTPSSGNDGGPKRAQDSVAEFGRFDIHVIVEQQGCPPYELMKLLDKNVNAGTRVVMVTHVLGNVDTEAEMERALPSYWKALKGTPELTFVMEPDVDKNDLEWKRLYATKHTNDFLGVVWDMMRKE